MYFNYVKWFVLRWMICTNLNNFTWNVECVLTMLKDLHWCWMVWTVQWNFLLENIPRKIASEFSLPWKSQQWTLPHKKTPLVEILPVIIVFLQMKKQTIFKISKKENKRPVVQLFYKNLVGYIRLSTIGFH